MSNAAVYKSTPLNPESGGQFIERQLELDLVPPVDQLHTVQELIGARTPRNLPVQVVGRLVDVGVQEGFPVLATKTPRIFSGAIGQHWYLYRIWPLM